MGTTVIVTSTEQNFTHTFRDPGFYEVELIATNCAGSNVARQTLEVIDVIEPEPDAGRNLGWQRHPIGFDLVVDDTLSALGALGAAALTVHGRTVNTAGVPTNEEATVIEDPSYANLQMNHYFTKSWEEFQAKRTRATTSTHAFQLPDVPFDIPATEDHVIDRWQPRTRALMEEMRTLARSPSRYGSKLRMPGFPVNDMFGQEATAVVTNEAAGLGEARKKRSFASLPSPLWICWQTHRSSFLNTPFWMSS